MATQFSLPGEQRLALGPLLDDLVADGMVRSEQAVTLKTIYNSMRVTDKHPLSIIAERNWPHATNRKEVLNSEMLTSWLADKLGLAYYRIDPLKIDVPSVTSVMSYAYAARFNILAVEVKPDEIVFATAEPFVEEWQNELAQILKKKITRVFANPEDISRYLLEFYSLSRSVFSARKEQEGLAEGAFQNLEQLMEMGRTGRLESDDQHVVSIVDWLLQYAFNQRASDIHLEPRRDQGIIRFRIDGVMHQVYQLPTLVMAAVTSRIKILGRMDVAEKRKPQDGRIKTRTPEDREIEMRLSTMPTAFGEKLVMRIFDPEVLVKDYSALGFSNKELEYWKHMITQPNGIILVTGPTGSGKTTTLYTTLKQLARPEVNVCTVEDPIELIEPSFNQMQVQHNINLNFATGVRTLLRQDPDIIMIGEIRDIETADIAIQAALTGHLVFSTLHTNDAPSAVARLLDIGVPPYLINATVLGVLAQRLIRTLCPYCKEHQSIDDDLWKSLVHPWKVNKPDKIFRPRGCLECRQTGYLGRAGIFEMMPVTEGIRACVTRDVDLSQLYKKALQEGMKTLRLNGAQKVANGMTTIQEVMKVAPPVME